MQFAHNKESKDPSSILHPIAKVMFERSSIKMMQLLEYGNILLNAKRPLLYLAPCCYGDVRAVVN